MKKHLLFFVAVYIAAVVFCVPSLQAQSNTKYGYQALFSNTTGTYNTAIGYLAMQKNTSGTSNSAFGAQALVLNTTGGLNTATGRFALFSNTTAFNNTAVGYSTLRSNTIGYENTATGSGALFSNISGYRNTANGYQALFSNSTGFHNSAMGYRALYLNSSGSINTAVGFEALRNNSTGLENTAVGCGALSKSTTSCCNTAVGNNALFNNTTGIENAAIGSYALASNNTGSQNTAFGRIALYNVTSGSNNTALGSNAGKFYNNTQSTFVGANSNATAQVFNSTALGYGAIVTAPNQVRIGNTSVTSIGGHVNWSVISDGRFKKNLSEDVPGLAFINQLRPVTYNLDVNSIESKVKSNTRNSSINGENASELFEQQPSPEEQQARAEKEKIIYTGFVAQEVEKAAKSLNYEFSGIDLPKSEEDFYGLRYAEFVVPLVKAVQELSKQNEELKERISNLEDALSKDADRSNNNITNVSGAYLEQNQPNPFNGSTVLRYYLPESVTTAKIVITGINGQLLKSIPLTGKGTGQVTLTASTLSKGIYTYSLWVNKQKVDSKQMLQK